MLTRIIEAILFASDAPLTVEQISIVVPGVTVEEISGTMDILRRRYEEEDRGWKLESIAGGWQLLSHPDMFPYVERFLEGKRRARISRAGLETLAVIAYRQPITRGELEQLRGVDCGGVLHTLMERDMVTIAGRSKAIGRPLYYATTGRFLEYFGMSSLNDLPRLEEIEALWASDEVRGQLEIEIEQRFPEVATAGGGNGESGSVERNDDLGGYRGGNGGNGGSGGNGSRGGHNEAHEGAAYEDVMNEDVAHEDAAHEDLGIGDQLPLGDRAVLHGDDSHDVGTPELGVGIDYPVGSSDRRGGDGTEHGDSSGAAVTIDSIGE
jgi:segregation and condensation protein B